MLPGLSIHHPTPNPKSTLTHSSYQSRPFSLFLKLSKLVPISGFILAVPSALTVLAPELFKLCSFCLSKSQFKCHLVREVFPGHAMEQCTLPSPSRYSITLPCLFLFKPTAFITIQISPLCVYSMAPPQNINFMRARMCPSCL